MTNQIVVFSMAIDRIVGKFKLSQNRSVPDRQGAIVGLRARGDLFDPALIELMEKALAARVLATE
jgi:predicted FMN-binding regulatory protein PaiB